MNFIIGWLKSKNITTHTTGALLIAVAVLVSTDTQAQQFLTDLLKDHPAIATQIIALAVIVAKYSVSRSNAGVVSAALTIAAGQNPPSRADVNAATP